MQTVIAAVRKENEQELQSWLQTQSQSMKVKNTVFIAETVIVDLECMDSSTYSKFHLMADSKSWAFNIVNFRDKVDYWPMRTCSVRFDGQGEIHADIGANPGHAEVRQVLHQMITLEPNDPRVKDRLFHAYLLRFEWENQYENGRLHQMRKLIGGL